MKNHYFQSSTRLSRRMRTVANLLALLVLLFISQQSYMIISHQGTAAIAPVQPSKLSSKTTTTTSTVPSTTAAVQAGAKSDSIVGSNSVAGSATTCQSYSYQQPNGLDLSLADNDLSVVVETPQTYTVSGPTIENLAAQLTACSPKLSGNDVYFAYTNYAASWQFETVANETGLCVVREAKVGMRIGEVVPKLADASAVSSDVLGRWTSFYTGLKLHEDGHVAIDKQAAATLLADMQRFPATACDSIQTMVNSVIQQDMAVLAQTNDNYDSTTNHGATQGAVLR